MITATLEHLRAASRSTLLLPMLVFPADARAHLVRCYRLLRAIDDDVDAQRSAAASRERAEHWRRRILAAAGSSAPDPAIVPYASTLRRGRTSEYAAAVVDAMPEQNDCGFASRATLEAWAARQNAPLGRLVLDALGCEGPWVDGYARQIGVAFQLVNIVKDLPDDLATRRVLLPLDEVGGGLVLAERRSDVERAVERLAARARELLAAAGRSVSSARVPPLAPVELWIELYLETLAHIERMGYLNGAEPRHLPLRSKTRVMVRWLARGERTRRT